MTDPVMAPMDDADVIPANVGCLLAMPNMRHLYDFLKDNAKVSRGRMLSDPVGRGKRVAICGAGPSLRDHLDEIAQGVDEVWACNSALPYLTAQGVRVTHAITVDQMEEMMAPHEFGVVLPSVHYYLATSTHPKVVRHILDHGAKISFFHSFLGIAEPDGYVRTAPDITYEMWLYQNVYERSVQVGFGLNTVPRALCLALYLQFDAIHVYGADCACAPNAPRMPAIQTPAYAAWLNSLVMYADGRGAGQWGDMSVMAEAEIDGTRWHTRPDMIISAVHLVELAKNGGRPVTLHGQTLPAALLHKDADFMGRLPKLTDVGKIDGFGSAELVAAKRQREGVHA